MQNRNAGIEELILRWWSINPFSLSHTRVCSASKALTLPFSTRVSYSQDRVWRRDRRSVRPRRNYFHGAWQSEMTSQSRFQLSHAESWLSPNCLMFFFRSEQLASPASLHRRPSTSRIYVIFFHFDAFCWIFYLHRYLDYVVFVLPYHSISICMLHIESDVR